MIELLIVMALLALMLSLALGAVGGSRAAGRRSATHATMRQHVATMGMYLQDFSDTHPWLGRPEDGIVTPRLPDGSSPLTIQYFESCAAWPVTLAAYYGDTWPARSQSYPGARKVMSRYLYSCAMIADPAFFDERTRIGSSQWRATRSSEVKFPASKALLTAAIDGEPLPRWVKAGLTFGLCDGAAKFVSKSQLAPPLASGDGAEPGLFHVRGYHGLDTEKGLRGVDIR